MGGLAPWGDPNDLFCERHNLTYAHDCDPGGCDCECPLCEEAIANGVYGVSIPLAGHEWPVKASAPNEDVLKAAAERIIARLEEAVITHSEWGVRYLQPDRAIRIVREECGL